MNIVAIITARGGSKGIPKKNIYPLNGIPLIAYSILAAKKTALFSHVVVSTDNEEIKAVAQAYEAEVIDRPAELATDMASSLDVIRHTLMTMKAQGSQADYFILLQPTSPLRTSQHILEAWSLFQQNNKKGALVSVCEEEHPPQKLLTIDDNQIVHPLFSWSDFTQPRQRLKKAYRINGAIYINHAETFLTTNNLFEQPLSVYQMDTVSSVDIDHQHDINYAEYLLSEAMK